MVTERTSFVIFVILVLVITIIYKLINGPSELISPFVGLLILLVSAVISSLLVIPRRGKSND